MLRQPITSTIGPASMSNSAQSSPNSRIPRWLVLAAIAVVLWGLWAVLGRVLGDRLTAGQGQALSTLGVLPVMGILAKSGRLRIIGDRKRGVLTGLASGLLVCLGNVAYYQALRLGEKTSTVIPLTALYPLVTIALAVLFLRERLNRFQGTGVVCALVAIYLFNVTAIEGVANRWILYAVIPIVLWGVSGWLQKISTQHLSGELSTQWFLVAFIPISLSLLVWEPLRSMPSLGTLCVVVGLGLFFGLGNLALLAAFAQGGKASVIAPVAGLYPIVSVPIAIVCFGERIGIRELAAIVLALGAVALLAWESPGSSDSTNVG